MMKIIQKSTQNNLYKAHTTTLILGVMILVTLLSINFISATTFTNSTGGFSFADDCVTTGGLTRDSDGSFWIACVSSDYAVHYTSAGINTTGAFPTAATGAAQLTDIAMNGTNGLWLLDDGDSAVYTALKTTGANLTGGFDTSLAGASSVSGVFQNATGNLFIVDNADLFCYNILNQVNQTDGWKCGWDGSGTGVVQMTDGTYWVLTANGIMEHYSKSHVNLTDGFDAAALTGGSAFRGLTTDGVDLWMNDATDKWVYYLVSADVAGSVSLNTPSNRTALSTVGTNFTANYTIGSSYNWTNGTYWIWNSTGVFNNTEIVLVTNTTNTTSHYIDAFVLGDYTWNVFGCYQGTTDSNCSWASSNYSLTVGASALGQNYSNGTYETANEEFFINLTLFPGTTFYDAQLSYNGTLYEATITNFGGDNYSVSTSLDIPLYTATTFDWFWKLIYETSSGFKYQNLTTHAQNISEINLSHIGCGTGSNLSLNFTAYDEEDLSAITDYKFYGTFEYWLGEGNIRKNISVSDTSVPSNFSMCLYPYNLTYYSDTQIQYEKTGFVKRSYYLVNATITNVTQNIGLYLLNSSASTSFIINILDEVQFAIKDAYIYIQRYYPGSGVFHTVEMAKTDDSGNTVGHFEAETEDYKIIVFKDGVILYESDMAKIFCGETPCTLNFQTEAADPTTWENYGDLPNLVWSLTYDDGLKIWTYTYVDTSGTTSYGRLKVYIEDGSTRTIICNNSDTSSAATLTCNVTDYDGTIYAEAYLSRSPELLVWLESIINRSVKAIFGMEGLFWATIIILTVGLIGLWNPAVGVIMLIAGMVTINYLQLATFGMTTIMGIIVIGIILLWEMRK